jgi:hypothetical protein
VHTSTAPYASRVSEADLKLEWSALQLSVYCVTYRRQHHGELFGLANLLKYTGEGPRAPRVICPAAFDAMIGFALGSVWEGSAMRQGDGNLRVFVACERLEGFASPQLMGNSLHTLFLWIS